MSTTAKTSAAPETAPAPSYDPVALAESLRTAAEKSAKMIGQFFGKVEGLAIQTVADGGKLNIGSRELKDPA